MAPHRNCIMLIISFLLVHFTVCSIVISEEELFSNFITTYEKLYRRGSDEYDRRFDNFRQSLLRHKKLSYLSSDANDAIYGVTKFSDLTETEFAEHVLSHPQNLHFNSTSHLSHTYRFQQQSSSIPKTYDLRKYRVVTAVNDQKQCGGCWAFSIVETLETQWALKHKTLYTLSVQELLDCTWGDGNRGCMGGNICITAQWLKKTSAKLTTAKVYPFLEGSGACRILKKSDLKVGITNYTCQCYVNRETEMVNTIADHGSLSVAVDATSWQDYVGGIIQHHCSDTANNHAVQVVGYDMSGRVPYYIVRNSWGKNWGLNGYLYIKIGNNLCGIANSIVTLTV